MDVFKLIGRIVIKNEEANQAIDATTQKAKDLGGALDGAGTSADTASSKMNSNSPFGAAAHWLGETLYKLTEKTVNLGLNLGKMGFGFDASMESYQYSFSALLGDADKAKLLIADIQKLAKETPLGLEKLANNAVNLLTTGIKLEDIIPTLEMLGNLSLGDPGRMDSVVRAFTQIISKGGLMAQEMYQLGDAMVPIREIMTEFGGARFADGSWYQQKMTDPTFKISSEEMVAAFQAATAEGGKWHDYMYIIMDSFAGMADRLGEEGKETLGDFFKPFFDAAKSEVMPKLIESLGLFRQWIADNKGTLEKMADAVGGLVSGGFDIMLNGLKWMMEHGKETATAMGLIATAMAVSAVAAHPYAAAVATIATALAVLTSKSDELAEHATFNHFFDQFSDEDLAKLQRWIDAEKEAAKAYDDMMTNMGDQSKADTFNAAEERKKAAYDEANAVKDLIATYQNWRNNQADGGQWLDVPLRVSEDSESSMQSEIENMSLDGIVKLYADDSDIDAALSATRYLNVVLNTSTAATGTPQVDGSHATGIWRVPRDGYIARLHEDETVLRSTEAAAYRAGQLGGGTGRVESLLTQVMTILQQIMSNTAAGHSVVLDSGVLVGQLAPQMDVQLGTILSRKGRRN